MDFGTSIGLFSFLLHTVLNLAKMSHLETDTYSIQGLHSYNKEKLCNLRLR